MKHFCSLLLVPGLAASLFGQAPGADPAPARTPEQLDELLEPMALYPDALVALNFTRRLFSD